MIDHPYADILRNVERPGRYLGGEFGAKSPDRNALVKMVLSYPDAYEIGMSHIGLGVLYETANEMANVACERVFMPWGDMEKALRDNDLPLLSLESATPLCNFDIVGFSLQYELTYTNLIAMLALGRIPRLAADRSDKDPLVIVGGPLATHCEPISRFVDLVVLGDGETSLQTLLRTMIHCKEEGTDRLGMLAQLHALPFAFAPSRIERVFDSASKRVVAAPADKAAGRWATVESLSPLKTGGSISPSVETVFDRFSLEVARGCTGGCRFCQAGFLYRPVRERNERDVADAVERAVNCTGVDGVSLASLSTADHSRLVPMLTDLGETFTPRQVSFFVPSLRAYGLDPTVVEVLSRLRATGVTLAPEAGSQRLRDVINKNISETDLIVAAARFFDWGLMRIKLYFMLGLPTETDDDLKEIIELAVRLRSFGRKRLKGRNPIVTVSVSTFVPKPFTPFAREPMLGGEEIRRRQQILIDMGRRERLEVRVHEAPLSILEGVLSRGDAPLGDLLEKAVDRGARFDGWRDQYRGDVWDELLLHVDLDTYLGPLSEGGRTPWDHVAAGVDQSFIEKEHARASAARPTAPCGRFLEDSVERFVCYHCGAACDRERVPLRSARPVSDIDALPEPRKIEKGQPRPRAHDEASVLNPTRVILYLAKWGRQAYVGHLDTVRHVMRALRRAGLTLYYTKGFNPKPKLSSAPPLPLGMAAMADPIEVFLIEPPDAETILARLAKAVPADMAFVRAEILPNAARGMSKRLIEARFVSRLAVDIETARAGVHRVLRAKELLVTRTRKGKTRSMDVRPYIHEIALPEETPPGLPVPPDPDRVTITFSLYLPGSGGCKPLELLEAVAGDAASNAWVVRQEIRLEPL